MTRRGWILFAALSVIWGIPYLLIRVADEAVSPPTLVLARTAIGAAIILPLAASRGELKPILPRWRTLLIYTAVEVAIPWVLLAQAEKRLASSLSGLLVAAVPLIGTLLVRVGGERHHLSRGALLGLAIGIGGVAVLVGFDIHGANLTSFAAMAVVATGYALGPIIISRKLSDLPSTGVVGFSLGVTAMVYAPWGIIDLPSRMPPGRVVASIIALGVVCTAAAFLFFFALIAEVGPVRATVITYVNPAVAVLLGVVLLNEPFTATTAVGFVLILGGSVLATGGGRLQRGPTYTDAVPGQPPGNPGLPVDAGLENSTQEGQMPQGGNTG
ncbi:MAG: DMT family transporter [Acidimicrobiales bacterium]